MNAIETSLFALSLDAHTLLPRYPASINHLSLVRPDIDAQVYNCSSAGSTGLNRWYDKALTVAVESNGRAGMLGEHSPCDALIPSMIVDYAIADHINPAEFEGAVPIEVVEEKKWRRLEWAVDATILSEIEAAKGRAQEVIADSDPSQLWYSEYGADWMKAVGELPVVADLPNKD